MWKMVIGNIKKNLVDFASPLGVTPDGKVADEELFVKQHAFVAMQFSLIFKTLSEEYGHIFNCGFGDINMSDMVANNKVLYVLLHCS